MTMPTARGTGQRGRESIRAECPNRLPTPLSCPLSCLNARLPPGKRGIGNASLFTPLARTEFRLEPTPGKNIEGDRNVDDAPGLVYAKPHHQRRTGPDSDLDSQLEKITQRFAEIQRNPI